ncbi:MAG: polyprenyl synthetase family protein [Dermabacteraceae bacterium]|uniref:polyprenyl synthetase family protein n=1 Tax=Brachybacterium sp. TaxID=1891286 RepID=UPI002650F918|nr:polyprenyl synthetase family protein [Brachybacterium sp.]MDN6302351.1 polyprenyl synthetase family protein [Brachybacterium sp.]MDN6328102.1 polyprenyl synthetase family protein [Brachybacterium sp.]
MTSADTPPVDAPLHDLDDRLVARVAEITRDELAERHHQQSAISPETAELADRLLEYLEGGKLLRPRFCFWGGVAALGQEPSEAQIDALARYGAAIELVQAAALMHDDVIDHSPVRRGRPALHIQAGRRHREAGLSGSAEDYGIAVAIVLGDLALSWAEQIAAGIEGEPGAVAAARREFDALRTEVMSGQFLDILHQAGGFSSADDAEQAAFSVIRWKTVPYTVLRPVRIGAALMGGSEEALETLSNWAVEVGTAFQLRDDLLSVVGDQHETGKPIGGDIIEGKRTVLLARTEAAAGADGRALLAAIVGRAGSSAQEITAVHDLMVSTGAVESVVQEIRNRAEQGRTLLAEASMLGGTGRAGLGALAALATDVESFTA